MADDAARKLRQLATNAETRLWAALRDRQLAGHKFRRQYRIGPFIADFASTRHRLIIEADGGQHAENAEDEERTNWLESRGWRVLRFWNNDILSNTEGVLTTILTVLKNNSPSPAPREREGPAKREGEGSRRG